MTNTITLLSYGFMGVGLGTLAYYYTRAMMRDTTPMALAQRSSTVVDGATFHQRPGTTAVPLTTSEMILGRKLGHTDPGVLDPGPVSFAATAKETQAVVEDDKRRIAKLFQSTIEHARSFAHLHPTIADPKYHDPVMYRHHDANEMAGSWRKLTPQYFIRRTDANPESGQRFYELVLPLRIDLGDILTDIAIKRLPNAANLHRIILNYSDNPDDAIQYTLGNLPKPGADGQIHLNLGDSPVLLFKMLRQPILVLTYTTEPKDMPEFIMTVGTLKDTVREELRKVANLMLPFDQKTNLYTMYNIRRPHNVDLVRR